MARVNLKELKETLNKLPDDRLEKFYIAHKMCLEDPEIELGLVFFDDEENWEKCMKLYERPEIKKINEFIKAIEYDMEKIQICKIDEDKAEDYADDVE